MTDQVNPLDGRTAAKTSWSQCTAKSKQSGQRCKRPAIKGGTVCFVHGGGSPIVKAKIARDRLEAEARQAVELWGGKRDIHPAAALLELVQRKAMEVEYWRHRVHEVQQEDEAALTWGRTKEKLGGEDHGTTREAKPHIALTLLHKAEADLANYCSAALKAGVDEAMVRIAQTTAGQFQQVINRALADPRLGVTVAGAVVDLVVTDALRAGIEEGR